MNPTSPGCRGTGRDASARHGGWPLLCPGRALAPRAEVPPRDYLVACGRWPGGPFHPDTPREACFLIDVARRLGELCADQSTRGVTVTAIAQRANLSTQTVFNLLEGKTWGDLPTIYRLEVALSAALWQNRDIGLP